MTSHQSPSVEPNSTASGTNTVADENVRAVAQIQRQSQRHRSLPERISDAVSAAMARESVIALHVAWFAIWIGLNVRTSQLKPFDPFPFSMLTTVVSLEAIFLTLFVLASQNRLTQESDRRAHLDLQVNLLSEQEMTLVLKMLGEVCEHLGLTATTRSQVFQELAKRTDVSDVASLVDRRIGKGD